MMRKRIAVVGLVGFTWVAVGCTGGTTGTTSPSSAQDLELRNYLGAGGEMYQWEEKIGKAVCNLEKFTTSLPLGGDRYCPGNGQWPPSDTPPPKFPPR